MLSLVRRSSHRIRQEFLLCLRNSVSQNKNSISKLFKTTDWAYLYNTSDGKIRYRKVGYIVELNVDGVVKEQAGYWHVPTHLPKGYRPLMWVSVPAMRVSSDNGIIFDHTAMIEVHDDGTVVIGVPNGMTNSSVSGYMNFIASN